MIQAVGVDEHGHPVINIGFTVDEVVRMLSGSRVVITTEAVGGPLVPMATVGLFAAETQDQLTEIVQAACPDIWMMPEVDAVRWEGW